MHLACTDIQIFGDTPGRGFIHSVYHRVHPGSYSTLRYLSLTPKPFPSLSSVSFVSVLEIQGAQRPFFGRP